MPRAKREESVVEADPDEQLDQATETDTLSGPIGPQGDDDDFLVTLGKELGYREEEGWERDPAKRLGLKDFLKNTPKVIAELKERGERQARAAAAAIEEERARKAEEATRIIRESDDPSIREAAAKSLREAAGPPPQTVAWLARNPWFDSDPDAKLIAANAIEQAFKSGASIEAQLQKGEEAAKRIFPQYFSNGTEQRLSDIRRSPAPPKVEEGSRATITATKEKGFAQIPRADREAFADHLLKAFMTNGLTKEAAEARYARSYWNAPPVDPSERGSEPFPMKPQPNVWAKKRAGR